MIPALPEHWLVPAWPVSATVRAIVTTRSGGASEGSYAGFNLGAHVGDEPAAVQRNRGRLRSFLPAEPVWLEQAHGTRVVDAATVAGVPRADAAVAHSPGIVCVVLTADCLPVLLSHRGGAAVAIAHAGWRGLAAGVVEATVERMAVAPREIVAWLGPAIGPRAYEVGRDVYDAFTGVDRGAADCFTPAGAGRFGADLYALARRRLAAAGVAATFGGGFCTFADEARFFSYRRDRVTGRFASLIWMDS